MTDSNRYKTTIEIVGPDKNSVESFLNDVHKRADEGRRVYGVDIQVNRLPEESEHTEGFGDE